MDGAESRSSDTGASEIVTSAFALSESVLSVDSSAKSRGSVSASAIAAGTSESSSSESGSSVSLSVSLLALDGVVSSDSFGVSDSPAGPADVVPSDDPVAPDEELGEVGVAELLELAVSAEATVGIAAVTVPTPKATASPATRPT